MINNVNIFTMKVIKILPTIYQNKTKVPDKNEEVPVLIIRKGKFC